MQIELGVWGLVDDKLSTAGAFMKSSACLVIGQEISHYVDVPEQEQVRLSESCLGEERS